MEGERESEGWQERERGGDGVRLMSDSDDDDDKRVISVPTITWLGCIKSV
jgi:hypothetical protein